MEHIKRAEKYYCKVCDFRCSKKSNYERHILTAKHKNRTNRTGKEPKKCQIIIDNISDDERYRCECGKVYKARNSYWYHKKKCTYINNEQQYEVTEIEEPNEKEEPNYKDLLIDAMKQMQQKDELVSEAMKEMTEMRKQMTDMMPLIGNNNNNTTNNHFNLNIFLNETCKDALNLTDFINSLQLQLEDLEYTADHGYIEGITNIFQKALSNMEVTKRPLHCTDLKRETLYIKDNDEWHKDETKNELKSSINTVANKNISNTSKWLDKYPGHTDADSKDFEKYVKMTNNSMGTGDDGEVNKITKNIMKEVIIDKGKT